MKKIFSAHMLLAVLRIMLGFVFFWAFIDKTFGLGFATKAADAWIKGGSPTSGFLGHAVQGPFAGLFHSLSGVGVIDWLFMAGLLFVGITLIFNKFVKWGALAGILMLVLMYLSLLWPANNPIVDDHLVYAILLGYIALRSEK